MPSTTSSRPQWSFSSALATKSRRARKRIVPAQVARRTTSCAGYASGGRFEGADAARWNSGRPVVYPVLRMRAFVVGLGLKDVEGRLLCPGICARRRIHNAGMRADATPTTRNHQAFALRNRASSARRRPVAHARMTRPQPIEQQLRPQSGCARRAAMMRGASRTASGADMNAALDAGTGAISHSLSWRTMPAFGASANLHVTRSLAISGRSTWGATSSASPIRACMWACCCFRPPGGGSQRIGLASSWSPARHGSRSATTGRGPRPTATTPATTATQSAARHRWSPARVRVGRHARPTRGVRPQRPDPAPVRPPVVVP
jgi:hypothetical protein